MALPKQIIDQIRTELEAVNGEWRDADKCYYFETDPPHVLFNTNCPDLLQSRIRSILSKYIEVNESNTP